MVSKELHLLPSDNRFAGGLKVANLHCLICGNSKNNRTHEAAEMMFGFKDKFTYFQCSNCDCLQIAHIPVDMTKYYPANYYSLNFPKLDADFLKARLRQMRNSYDVFGKGFVGRLLRDIRPNQQIRELGRIGLTKKSRILDVGSGNGMMCSLLKEIGFNDLLGIDPFLKEDVTLANGVREHVPEIVERN